MSKGTRRSHYRIRRRSRAFQVVVVVALLAAGALLYFRLFPGGEEAQEGASPPLGDAAELAPAAPEIAESWPAEEEEGGASPPPVPEAVSLPALDESDPMIRELAGDAAAGSELRAWLEAPDLIRRFVAGVSAVADGESPREQLLFLAPEERFRVVQQDGYLVADPRSHARYDVVADVFASLHVPTLVGAYRLVEPLFEEAFGDLGIPDQSFEETLGRALRELLQTPPVEGAVELRRVGNFYEYLDEELEGRSPAQRHLLRMGPRNALRIQAKLREIQSELGIAEEGR